MQTTVFSKCCSFKHQEKKGQQKKAIRMLQNKTGTIKTIREQYGIYFRVMMKK